MSYLFLPRMLEKSINGLIVTGIITLCFGLLGQSHWLLDLHAHFRVYHFFLFLLLAFASLLFRRYAQLAICSAFVLFLAGTFLRFYWPHRQQFDEAEGLRICSINLLSSNDRHDEVKEYLHENNFDIVVVQELNKSWEKALIPLRNKYPYLEFRSRDDNFGIGIMSKLPFNALESLELKPRDLPTLVATVLFKHKPLTLITTHTLPPVGTADFTSRNAQFEQLNALIRSSENELILIGDLNSTDFSPNFDLLIRDTGLTDTRLGHGMQPSWNAHFRLLSIPIDHAWISGGLQTLVRETGPDLGSDHLPIVVEIDWR